MRFDEYRRFETVKGIAEAIAKEQWGQVKLMEVCGTHTAAIAKAGIKEILPGGIKLVSGPGCPVCVTPAETIDRALALSMEPEVIITTYGDMIRVPGSARGDSLMRRQALGAQVRIVYSPMDAVEIAMQNPNKQVVFLGVGFETTAPGTAIAVEAAIEADVKNFTVFSMLKTVEPALRTLAKTKDFDIDGLLCPGHVAAIIGERGFEFLPKELRLPAVIGGFEPADILVSVYKLLQQIKSGEAKHENEYTRVVAKEGNPAAMAVIDKYFEKREDRWRGLGDIQESGLGLKEEFSFYDAEKRFNIPNTKTMQQDSLCSCGSVICGKTEPEQCPLFATICVPEDPMGPCMVSGEGACAIAYKYRRV